MDAAWSVLKSNTIPIRPRVMQYATDPKKTMRLEQTGGIARRAREKLMDEVQAERNHDHPDSFSEGETDVMNQHGYDGRENVTKGNNFFDNMRAKKKRGEKTAKPGHEDYPDKKQWKDITAKAEKPFHGYNPNKHSRKGGLNAKGRATAKRETGANLKRPVTKKPSTLKPGSKAANRRKSFCARMTGVKGPTSKGGKHTPKGAALKRLNC